MWNLLFIILISGYYLYIKKKNLLDQNELVFLCLIFSLLSLNQYGFVLICW